jgi:SAM-dependent methyltransferase
MKTAFNQEKFDLAYPPDIESHYWTLARNHIIERQLRATNVVTPKTLEIGCGKGVVVDWFRRKGYDCWGVELAPGSPIHSVEKYIFTGQDAFQLPSEIRCSFDIIFLLDLIEHLPDAVSFLSKVVDSFPNAAYLIITVPARQELWSQYDEYYQHFRRYTIETLENTIETTRRCKIKGMRYFFHVLYVPVSLAVSLFSRPLEIKAPSNLSKPFHYLLSKLCIWDYFLMPHNWYGTSIICRVEISRKCGDFTKK